MPGYQTTLVEAQSDGTAVTATAEGSLLPGQARIFVPSGYMNRIGKRFAVRASGRISNIVTTPGTLMLRLKAGPTANIAIATSTAWALNTTAKTNVGWYLDLTFTVRSIGAGTTATIFAMGTLETESLVGSAAGISNTAQWQASAPVVGTGFDSTVDNLFDLTAQFSLTGNSIQLHTYGLEDLTATP